MKAKLKPLSQQILVLTGATSGIGLVTARMAAKRGARLVLAARGADALNQLANELNASPAAKGRTVAVPVVADVAKEADVAAIAQAAQEHFGGFDTWINNAGISIYGRIEDTPVADMRRLFDTNFFGLVQASLEAVRHLKTRPGGGVLIQIGSELSDRTVPLQGVYCASKHAVKGFTDGLRMDLEKENAPVYICLVKPGAIDTPYPHHAKSFLASEPKHGGPVYAPETVARAILTVAEKPVRDVWVGGAAALVAKMGAKYPALTDKLLEASFYAGSESGQPPRPHDDNGLDRSVGRLQERGGFPGHVKETSAYTEAVLHPAYSAVALAALVGVGLGVTAWAGREKPVTTARVLSSARRYSSVLGKVASFLS